MHFSVQLVLIQPQYKPINYSVGGLQIAGDQIQMIDSQIRFDFARTSQIGVGTFGDTVKWW